MLNFFASTRAARSNRSPNGPPCARASKIVSSAAPPTPRTAPRPKRICGPQRVLYSLAAQRFPVGCRVRVDDLEVGVALVDVGREHRHPHRARVGDGADDLLDLVLVARHDRAEELDRVVRLQVGGLVRDERVRRGVALVEAVAGEELEQPEDRLGVLLRDAVLRSRPRRRCSSASPSPRASSCPSRGGADRRRRASSRRAPGRSA